MHVGFVAGGKFYDQNLLFRRRRWPHYQGKLAGRILRPLIDLLFKPLEREHCRKSFESELQGAKLPEPYRVRIP